MQVVEDSTVCQLSAVCLPIPSPCGFGWEGMCAALAFSAAAVLRALLLSCFAGPSSDTPIQLRVASLDLVCWLDSTGGYEPGRERSERSGKGVPPLDLGVSVVAPCLPACFHAESWLTPWVSAHAVSGRPCWARHVSVRAACQFCSV